MAPSDLGKIQRAMIRQIGTKQITEEEAVALAVGAVIEHQSKLKSNGVARACSQITKGDRGWAGLLCSEFLADSTADIDLRAAVDMAEVLRSGLGLDTDRVCRIAKRDYSWGMPCT